MVPAAWRCSTGACRPAETPAGRSRWFAATTRNAVTARLAMAGSRTIMLWHDEVGVADAGYVRCGYLLTVPRELSDACRGNVAMLQAIGLDTRFIEPGEIRRSSPSCRWKESQAPRTSRTAGSPTRRRCAWAGSRRRQAAASDTTSAGRWHAIRVEAGRARRPRDRGRLRPDRPDRPGHRGVGERPAAAARRRAADRASPAAGAGGAHSSRPLASVRGLLGRGDERRRPTRPGSAVLRRRLRR